MHNQPTLKLQELLYRVRPTATRPIFQIELPIADAEKLLLTCLKLEVESRGRKFIYDEPTKQNVRNVARWLTSEKKKNGLLLYGEVGTGKTIMVRAIGSLIRAMYSNARSSENRYLSVVSAIDLSKIYNPDKEAVSDRNDQFIRYKTAQWLAIDDLGTEPLVKKSFGNELTPISDLLFHRYDHQLMTIITTNDNDKTIAEKYDVRIADRFNEMFNRVSYIGQSYRKN
ncbi:MAG: DnaA/Hda family protein [Mucinivorans sp.]